MCGCHVDSESCPGRSSSILNIWSGASHLEFSAKHCNHSRLHQDLFARPKGVWFAGTVPCPSLHIKSPVSLLCHLAQLEGCQSGCQTGVHGGGRGVTLWPHPPLLP